MLPPWRFHILFIDPTYLKYVMAVNNRYVLLRMYIIGLLANEHQNTITKITFEIVFVRSRVWS